MANPPLIFVFLALPVPPPACLLSPPLFDIRRIGDLTLPAACSVFNWMAWFFSCRFDCRGRLNFFMGARPLVTLFF